jgi:hypothetical protein
MSAAPPKTHGRQPMPSFAANATSMIPSFDQKPENGGTPRIASQPRPNVTHVIFMAPLSRP